MLINHNGNNVKLPDFLIVGAARSGTTSLHYYLKQHPGIFMPKVKELYFFTFMDAPPNYIHKWWKDDVVSTFDNYITYFESARETHVIGEVCTTYLFHYADTIKNIKRVYGEKYKDLKIIIILRNPAEVAYSMFMMKIRDNQEPIHDFREAIKPDVITERIRNRWAVDFDYPSIGMYYESVNAFMKEFPNIRIFLYDDFSRDNLDVVKEIFDFLGVDRGFVPNLETRYNISGKSRFGPINAMVSNYYLKKFIKGFIPMGILQKLKSRVSKSILEKEDMPTDIRKELMKYYEDNIVCLQKLINKDLSKWLA